MEADTTTPPRARGQRGESLLESLIAIAVLSMIVAASYAGLQVAMRASVQQTESAVAGTMLRNAAEMLQDPDSDYIDRAGCKGAKQYGNLPEEPGYGTVAVDVRFIEPPSGGNEKALRVEAEPEVDPARLQCPEVDPGLQEMDLSVTTPSGRIQTLQIVKRRP